MTVCYFGNYNPTHPRNIIFLKCLRRAGHEVIEVNIRERGFIKYIHMARALLAARNRIDAVMVGFPGPQALLVAKLCYRGPVVFNALLSLYDAAILDRGTHAQGSVRALYYWLLDFLSFHCADRVILDCEAQISFCAKKFSLSRRKFSKIYLGADEDVFKPSEALASGYEIHYYSSFIPTHGTDVILKAAKILESEGVKFIFSGRGQCYARDRKIASTLGLRNVQFIERMSSPEKLNEFLNTSWIAFGIFGQRPRTDRIISSKVFEAMCCACAVVTEYTTAGAELLQDKESVLFVTPNDPEDLAAKIRQLKHDALLRQRIASGARRVYARYASFKVITEQLNAALTAR